MNWLLILTLCVLKDPIFGNAHYVCDKKIAYVYQTETQCYKALNSLSLVLSANSGICVPDLPGNKIYKKDKE